MKTLLRLSGGLLLMSLFLFAGPPNIQAQDLLTGLDVAAGEGGAGFAAENADSTVLIARVVNAVITISGVIFLILLVYGGMLYMLAGGSEDNVKKAKRLLVSSVIGLIIIVSSYAISFYVFEKLAEVTGETTTAAP
jgi:hypothetical protein